jgi:glyoxylase-like metal-dependent hydrolase (beta-lactamase superfamily II)
MILETLAVGPFQANCYILGDETTRQALVLDPGADFEKIIDTLQSHQLKVDKIVLTHAHGDHIGAVRELMEQTQAELYLHEADLPLLTNPKYNLSEAYGLPIAVKTSTKFLLEGNEVTCGTVRMTVIHTPGHTPGGICLLGDGFLFTGDTLFNGSVGRTDFPYSSTEILMQSIVAKIMVLDDETKIYPGHGPASRLGWEKKYNPFLAKGFLFQFMIK